jgi:tRNA dimethylallyltransferase
MSPPDSDPRPPVVVITGPTAAGKTALAIELAQRFDAEVVNADSMQVYRFMDIGTSKPSVEQRSQVRHHLIDVVDPDAAYSAGRFATESRAAAKDIHARGKIVILAGGTGLYVRAFLEGLIDAGDADPALRADLEQQHERAVGEGEPTRLHGRLADRDPEAATRIHPNDIRRVIRALELCERQGRPASRVRGEHAFEDRPYCALHLALDPGPEILDPRIDACCERMIEDGLLREVRALREHGYGSELRSMGAIGYRHMQPVADGSDTLVNALAAMQRDTRRFSRRQRTWLRAVPETIWMDPREPEAVHTRVEEFLASPTKR